MKTIEIIETNAGHEVHLPAEFRFNTNTVSSRREGDAVILEPLKLNQWPEGFFESIRIDDPTFVRHRHEYLHRFDAESLFEFPAS